jgi:hypothetical protein
LDPKAVAAVKALEENGKPSFNNLKLVMLTRPRRLR